MAKLFKTSGEIVDIAPENAKKRFSLEELYQHIGCSLIDAQCMENKDKEELWFIADDEGLLRNEPELNRKATAFVRAFSGFNWTLFGNVVICNGNEFK